MRILVYTNPLGNSITLYKDPYLITTLSGIDMPEVNEQSQKAPYQDGVTDLDALFSPRTITVEGSIQSQQLPAIFSDRASAMAQLNPKLGLGTLTYTNEQGTFTTACRCISALFPNKLFTDPFQNFQLQFFCPDPYWYAQTQSMSTLRVVSNGFTFPMTFPIIFGTFTGTTPVPAVNAGDSITPVIISFYGPAVNPVITNNTTGELVKCNITLNNGDVLIINTKFGSKSISKIASNGIVTNQASTLDATSTFWQLNIGTNSISFSDDLFLSLEYCTISWYNRYVGK
jgi:hypothetical protein